MGTFMAWMNARGISPEELACLVSKLNVDAAAGTEVFSHYGHLGAPRLGASAGGQTCDRWSLRNRETEGEQKEE